MTVEIEQNMNTNAFIFLHERETMGMKGIFPTLLNRVF